MIRSLIWVAFHFNGWRWGRKEMVEERESSYLEVKKEQVVVMVRLIGGAYSKGDGDGLLDYWVASDAMK